MISSFFLSCFGDEQTEGFDGNIYIVGGASVGFDGE